MDKRINNIISLKLAADYISWDKEVYYKPNFTANLSVPINLRNKIKVAPSVCYSGKRNASNDDQFLSPYFHANMSLYYSYTKQLSAYLQLSNLTGTENEIWLGYKEVGFNGVFGINYFF